MVNVAEVQREANANVIKLNGDIANETIGQIQEIVDKIVEENKKDIILDLSGVDFVDSKGAGFLLSLKQKLFGKRRIVLAAAPSGVLGVLTRLMITEQFKVCATVKDALMRM